MKPTYVGFMRLSGSAMNATLLTNLVKHCKTLLITPKPGSHTGITFLGFCEK